jgi:hypothetical protein
MNRELHAILEGEADLPPPDGVDRLVAGLRELHGPDVLAVLFYGSCRRDRELKGRLADLYLVLDGYQDLHGSRLSRFCNRLVPPNVYYFETGHEGRVLRAKYATVTLDHLERLVAPGTINPYFWARFAQPTSLLWTRDDVVRRRLLSSFVQAIRTLLAEVRPLIVGPPEGAVIWPRAFALTYATELRSEGTERARLVYEADRARYDRVAQLVMPGLPKPDARVRRRAASAWSRRKISGKSWSVLRLVKAGFTFQGGADYLAYKIERHSGIRIEVKPWHRRHPHLAAFSLFWRLYRRGAFR